MRLAVKQLQRIKESAQKVLNYHAPYSTSTCDSCAELRQVIKESEGIKLKMKVVHKQRYLRMGMPVAICGKSGNIKNHSAWSYVTCKRCIKISQKLRLTPNQSWKLSNERTP